MGVGKARREISRFCARTNVTIKGSWKYGLCSIFEFWTCILFLASVIGFCRASADGNGARLEDVSFAGTTAPSSPIADVAEEEGRDRRLHSPRGKKQGLHHSMGNEDHGGAQRRHRRELQQAEEDSETTHAVALQHSSTRTRRRTAKRRSTTGLLQREEETTRASSTARRGLQQALVIETVSSPSKYVNGYPVHLRMTWETTFSFSTVTPTKMCVSGTKGTLDPRTELYVDLRTANGAPSFVEASANWFALPRIPYERENVTSSAFLHCGMLDAAVDLYYDSQNVRQIRSPELSVYQFEMPANTITAASPRLVFDLRKSANPLETNSDTNQNPTMTINYSNLRAASGIRNAFFWGSMEVLQFAMTPYFYARSDATLEVAFRIRGLRQKKQLPENSWIGVDAPQGISFSPSSSIQIFAAGSVASPTADVLAESATRLHPVLFTDCGRIGSVCTGSYLGAQLGATYEYNNQDWETALAALFSSNPRLNQSLLAAQSSGTLPADERPYVLGPQAGNLVVDYANDTLPSQAHANRDLWSYAASSARYTRATLDQSAQALAFSLDDTVLLKIRITGVTTPQARTTTTAGAGSSGTTSTTTDFWRFTYGLIQSDSMDKLLGLVSVHPRDPMIEEIRSASIVVKGFTTGSSSSTAMSSAPYSSYVQLVITISGSNLGGKRFFYLWTDPVLPTTPASASKWIFTSTNCRGDEWTLSCYVVDPTESTLSNDLTSMQRFSVFGETSSTASSEVRVSLFALSPKPTQAGLTPSTAAWRVALSSDATAFANLRNHVTSGGSTSLTLKDLLDYNSANLNFVSHLSLATPQPPPLDFISDFRVRAVPAVSGTIVDALFSFRLRKIDLVSTGVGIVSTEPVIQSLRLVGPCEILSFTNGVTLARVTSGIQKLSTFSNSVTIPVQMVKLIQDREVQLSVELRVAEVPSGYNANTIGAALASIGQQPFDHDVNKWVLQILGTGGIATDGSGAGTTATTVLDLGETQHFSVAAGTFDSRSQFSAVSSQNIVFHIHMPDTTALVNTFSFTLRLSGLTLKAPATAAASANPRCSLFPVPGASAALPQQSPTDETFTCWDNFSKFEISNIMATRRFLTFQVKAELPSADDGVLELFQLTTTPVVNGTGTTTQRVLLQHAPLRLGVGPISSRKFSQCGSQITIESSAIDPLDPPPAASAALAAVSDNVTTTTTLAPNLPARTVSEGELLRTEPVAFPAQNALGSYWNQLHAGNNRVRIKTIPSLDGAYSLQDDTTLEFLLWTQLEPTDNVWLRGGQRVSSVSTTCASLASENEAQRGGLDFGTAAEKEEEIYQTVLLAVMIAIALLFALVVLYSLCFHRDDCISRLKLILVLRYNYNPVLTKSFYDYYGDNVGGDVALTYPSYWSIADERKLARVREIQSSPSPFKALSDGASANGSPNKKSSQDWPSKDDYYIPPMPVGMDVYDLAPSAQTGSGGNSGSSAPQPMCSMLASPSSKERRSSSTSLAMISPSPKADISPSSAKSHVSGYAPSCRFHICDEHVVEGVQRMLDETWRTTWTRDRKRLAARIGGTARIPTRLEVGYVARVENTVLWERYAKLRSSLFQLSQGSDLKVSAHRPVPLSTRSWDAAGLPQPELFQPLNEFLFFHGTNPSAAESIANEGFRISYAGRHGGSMYGAGIYASESCTKADEYSREEWLEDDNYCAMLVVRALAARVYYTADPHPDPNYIESLCRFNRFDSVLGDREKARDTFKEWVFFKTEQVYPEYIVRYKRRFDVRPPSYGAKLLHGVSYRLAHFPQDAAQFGRSIGSGGPYANKVGSSSSGRGLNRHGSGGSRSSSYNQVGAASGLEDFETSRDHENAVDSAPGTDPRKLNKRSSDRKNDKSSVLKRANYKSKEEDTSQLQRGSSNFSTDSLRVDSRTTTTDSFTRVCANGGSSSHELHQIIEEPAGPSLSVPRGGNSVGGSPAGTPAGSVIGSSDSPRKMPSKKRDSSGSKTNRNGVASDNSAASESILQKARENRQQRLEKEHSGGDGESRHKDNKYSKSKEHRHSSSFGGATSSRPRPSGLSLKGFNILNESRSTSRVETPQRSRPPRLAEMSSSDSDPGPGAGGRRSY
ncbi:unnamed protein product [Amoebophrya sp. A25]|nr:unnamed protein product [Amoebophrya sp. A25]|eukprot:GSA25T00009776001.1